MYVCMYIYIYLYRKYRHTHRERPTIALYLSPLWGWLLRNLFALLTPSVQLKPTKPRIQLGPQSFVDVHVVAT